MNEIWQFIVDHQRTIYEVAGGISVWMTSNVVGKKNLTARGLTASFFGWGLAQFRKKPATKSKSKR